MVVKERGCSTKTVDLDARTYDFQRRIDTVISFRIRQQSRFIPNTYLFLMSLRSDSENPCTCTNPVERRHSEAWPWHRENPNRDHGGIE